MPFEDLSQYCTSNFSHLNKSLDSEIEIIRYYSKWAEKYSKIFKNSDSKTAIDWDVRTSKSLKEVFTSTSFYFEAQFAKKMNSWTSFYFLSYYSLFHALLSCVYLLPNEDLESLSEITHSKLKNVFYSTFSNSKPYIVNKDIKDLFELLKYVREYYSYQMPFNDFLYNSEEVKKPDTRLPFYLRCCFQLASLHSEIIEKSFSKHSKFVGGDTQFHKYKKETFMRANSRKHPLTDKYILDPSDKFRIKEMLSSSGPTSFVINIEHYFDEFRSYICGYTDNIENRATSHNEIISFIYKAIQ